MSKNKPSIRKITLKKVKEKLELYWSPRQQCIDPTMMGASLATDIYPQIINSFMFSEANSFNHSKWRKDKSKELETYVVTTMGEAARGWGVNLSFRIYSPFSGSNFWREVFDVQDLESVIIILNSGSLEGADKCKITVAQQKAVSVWLETFVSEIKAYEICLEKYIDKQVTKFVKHLMIKADQGLPPEKWL